MNTRDNASLENHFADQPFEIIKEYHSKKNTVILIHSDNKPIIVKRFHPSNKKGMEREIRILKMVRSIIHAPRIYQIDKQNILITMEYINGENLCDLIHNPLKSYDKKNQIIEEMARWFAHFHFYIKENNHFLLKGDAHIRNFIVSNQGVNGIDFEESIKGPPSIDIAECCVSILLTTPVFTDEKLSWCKRFKMTYQNSVSWTLDEFESIFFQTLYTIIERRENHDELHKIITLKKKKIEETIFFQ